MRADFQLLATIAGETFAGAFLPGETGCTFAISHNGLETGFASIPGEPAMVCMRTKVVDAATLARPGDFAKAALAANFFWSGTGGATISLAPDGALYLVERRAIAHLASPEALAAALDETAATAGDWQERSRLYA